MKLTHHDIQEILQLLDASGYDTLDLETDNFRLTLQRTADKQWVREETQLGQAKTVGHQAPSQASSQAAQAAPEAAETLAEGLLAVRAPLPGTFYRAPKPGAAPFVKEGDRVDSSQVVGIIETMKLMNSVYADQAGIIKEIRIPNGQAVEQGTILLTLEPEEA